MHQVSQLGWALRIIIHSILISISLSHLSIMYRHSQGCLIFISIPSSTRCKEAWIRHFHGIFVCPTHATCTRHVSWRVRIVRRLSVVCTQCRYGATQCWHSYTTSTPTSPKLLGFHIWRSMIKGEPLFQLISYFVHRHSLSLAVVHPRTPLRTTAHCRSLSCVS